MRQLEVPIDPGEGPPVVILHGFAMRPATYDRLVALLAPHCRVIVPDLFAVPGRWRYSEVVDAFTASLDALDVDRVTMIGHSFGGGIELGFAARYPARVVELVFSDTLAVTREWGLAEEALRHPGRMTRLATPRATTAFAKTWLRHPVQLVDAAMWAFRSGRDHECEVVANAGIRAHVLWANRDSILSRSDGERFARDLGATFTVASSPAGRPIDHDWMFEQPKVFFDHLQKIGLRALRARPTRSVEHKPRA
jgi:pimeloyl-ACP methyl ester carboxylesterase